MDKVKKVISWPVILGLQVISTCVFLFFIVKLNVIPTVYTAILVMLLALLCLVTFALMTTKKRRHHDGEGHHHHVHRTKPREIVGKIISLLLSILMIFGSVMVSKGNSALDDITGANTKSTHYAIVVLKSSKINSLKDLQNESIEYCLQNDNKDDMNKVIKQAQEKESSISYDSVISYANLGDDLYNHTVNAILVNTALN